MRLAAGLFFVGAAFISSAAVAWCFRDACSFEIRHPRTFEIGRYSFEIVRLAIGSEYETVPVLMLEGNMDTTLAGTTKRWQSKTYRLPFCVHDGAQLAIQFWYPIPTVAELERRGLMH